MAARGARAAGERIRRVGVLMVLAEDHPDTKARLAGLQQGLEKLGWSEGRNVRIDYRFAPAGTGAQGLAKELVALQPDVILGSASPATRALQRETDTIPIVFTASPIRSARALSPAWRGRVAISRAFCCSKPTSRASGWRCSRKSRRVSGAQRSSINPKTAPYYEFYLGPAQAAASSLGIELVLSALDNAPADIERALDALARVPNSGLVLPPDTNTSVHRDLIIALAARHRLPAVYSDRLFVVAGGLMCYSTDRADQFRTAASYVDRILRGAKPADLPVQVPTKYETVINLKTAKALGLDRAAKLLVAADEVIE